MICSEIGLKFVLRLYYHTNHIISSALPEAGCVWFYTRLLLATKQPNHWTDCADVTWNSGFACFHSDCLTSDPVTESYTSG